jgi:hypothetical protein
MTDDITRNFSGGAATSQAARESLSDDHLSATKRRILDYVRRQGSLGATSDQIQRELGIRHASGGRITEMVRDGLLKAATLAGGTPIHRATTSGRAAQVWVAGDGVPVAKPSRRRPDPSDLLRDVLAVCDRVDRHLRFSVHHPDTDKTKRRIAELRQRINDHLREETA